MAENYNNQMTHEEFIEHINKICNNLSNFLKDNNIKIDYICPILRSGAIPAVYIANKLNIVKFLPMQIKHITFNNGDEKIQTILNPIESVYISKNNPIFLIVDALQYSGKSTEITIKAIKNKYKDAQILFVCICKKYGSPDFKDLTIYEYCSFYFNGDNAFSEEKCRKLGIRYFFPLFPWEILELEKTHPDDLEENIFF